MRHGKYRLTFNFFDTRESAEKFSHTLGRKKHTITPWESEDKTEHKYIVWYYI